MDPQRVLLDDRVGPGAGNEFFLADRLAGALDERHQDLQRAAAETQRLPLVEQHALGGDQSKRPEYEGLVIHGGCVLKDVNIHTDRGKMRNPPTTSLRPLTRLCPGALGRCARPPEENATRSPAT